MNPVKKFFLTGIGTEIGKTIVSAILVEKLKADYWKPIQSGSLEETDTQRVKSLIINKKTQFHPEAIKLIHPYSPHKAADMENRYLRISEILPPNSSNTLICEGAGGLMVPINEKETNLDLIRYLGYPIILVSRIYLGSINHTLLSIEKIRSEKLPFIGIIFVGEKDPYTEDYIAQFTEAPILGRIPFLETIHPQSIKAAGDHLNFNLGDLAII